MDIHSNGNGSDGHSHNGHSANGQAHDDRLHAPHGHASPDRHAAAGPDALDVRCPGCRKLLMRGDEIKCPRCKEIVKLDPTILQHPVVKALVEELSELKSRLGLVH